MRSGKPATAADDRAWLDDLVRREAPRLLAYVRRTWNDQADAEDIVAETFCRAAKSVRSLRASDRPDLYLLATARNLCRDRFRRRRPQTAVGGALDAWPAGGAAAGDRVEQGEQEALLRAAVAELPEGLREVVVLRLGAELTFEEIAEMLHVPLGTALSRMHAAVGRLRSKLGCHV